MPPVVYSDNLGWDVPSEEEYKDVMAVETVNDTAVLAPSTPKKTASRTFEFETVLSYVMYFVILALLTCSLLACVEKHRKK